MIGYFPQFHTPGDLPEAVTSPALLGQTFAAVREAVDRLTAFDTLLAPQTAKS